MRYELVQAHNPGPYTGAGNNTYLIPGEEPVLIDAGTGDPRHLEGVAEALARTKSGRLARILVTHGHVDHESGVAALAVRWPEATASKMPWPERDARYWQAWHEIGDEELIRAHHDVLRPGGLALISVPNAACASYRVWKMLLEVPRWWPYGLEIPYSRAELVRRAATAGFTQIQVFATGFWQSLGDHWLRGFPWRCLKQRHPDWSARRSRLDELMGAVLLLTARRAS